MTRTNQSLGRSVFPRHAIPRHAIPRHAIPRLAIPRLAIPRLAIPRLAIPRLAIPRLAITLPALCCLAGVAWTQHVTIRQSAPADKAVRTMLSHRRSLAATADGRLWSLVRYEDGKGAAKDASRHLLFYASSDAGRSWKLVTDTRTTGDVWGSLVVDPDGYTLHVTWDASNGATPRNSTKFIRGVWYASFDTRTNKWNGANDTAIAPPITSRSDDWGQFFNPDIEVTPKGTVVIAFYNRYFTPSGWGRAGRWNGYVTANKGQGWSTPVRINADTYGVNADLQAHGEVIHSAYRTNSGLYGTRYRTFDTATGKLGPEIPLPAPTGASTKIHGNINHIAVVPNGDVYVLYGRDARERNSELGEVRVAYMKSGSGKFTADTRLADYYRDPGKNERKLGGNNSHYHFTLATNERRQPIAVYGIRDGRATANPKEQYENLYMNILTPTGALPRIRLSKGGRKDQFKMLTGFRNTSGRHTLLATYSDLSAIGPLIAGRAVMLNLSVGLAVVHGLGCSGALKATPQLGANNVPVLGSKLGLDIALLPASAGGVLFLGANDQTFFNIPLPLDLRNFGLTGCSLYQDILLALPYVATPQGFFSTSLPIPQNNTLKGLPIFWQSLVVAPGSPGNAVMTNGLSTIAQ